MSKKKTPTMPFKILSLDDNEDDGGFEENISDEEVKNKPVSVAPAPDQGKKVRIELSRVIEHNGKYYRGVLDLEPELAEKLLDLEKNTI